MSATDSIPPQLEMLSTETLPLSMDFTPLLQTSETLSNPVATLTQIDTGASFAAGLSGNPTVVAGSGGASKGVQQVVTGLTPKKSYILDWTATVASNKIVAQKTRIDCPF